MPMKGLGKIVSPGSLPSVREPLRTQAGRIHVDNKETRVIDKAISAFYHINNLQQLVILHSPKGRFVWGHVRLVDEKVGLKFHRAH